MSNIDHSFWEWLKLKNFSLIAKIKSLTNPQTYPIPKLFSKISLYLIYLMGLFVVIYMIFYEYTNHNWNWIYWDWLYISGLFAFLIVLYLGRTIPFKMSRLLDRLKNREVLNLTHQDLSSLKSRMDQRAQSFSVVMSAIFGPAAILIINQGESDDATYIYLMCTVLWIAAFLYTRLNQRSQVIAGRVIVFLGIILLIAYPLTDQFPVGKIGWYFLFPLLYLVAFYYFGQIFAFSTLGQMVTDKHILIETKPNHIDGAAGLQPIGSFYFFQAMVLAIPGIFLAGWWFIIPILTPWYAPWRSVFLGVLVIFLVIFILAFILPMWVFHQIMREQKNDYQLKSDKISKEIGDLETKIVNEEDPKISKSLEGQLNILRTKYFEIEQMPTWPVDRITRHRFTLNNLFLFLPILLEKIGASETWNNFLNTLVKIFSQE